ncbi:MAG: pilus assembly protein PilM [Candidatus Magasanikbacteria bacterium]|nr:pilus assembly protein PilM [Candidatus Magasanikbacteria bacterium]
MGGDKVNEILARAWNKPVGDVENMKIDVFESLDDLSDPEVDKLLQPVFLPIIRQIEIVLETARRSSSDAMTRPDKIILTGGATHMPMLAKKIEEHFSIKTFAGDPWTRVVVPPSLKPMLDRIGPRFCVAIGLAERMIVSNS